jgi:RNA polymerase sigma factor (sigma-70 family)
MNTGLHSLPSETVEGCSDAALVEAAQLGDRCAFGVLVERHQHLIWTIAYCLTGSVTQSEEVSQETFCMAWSRLGELRNRQSFKGWLRKIAHNFSMRSHRNQGGQRFEKLAADEEAMASSGTSPLDNLIEREEARLVRWALQRIPDAYRVPLVLFYRQDKSVESVAAALDLSEGAVKLRLMRGRRLLRDEVIALMEPILARRRPTGQFTAAVLVAISGVAVGSAHAGPAVGPALAVGRSLCF